MSVLPPPYSVPPVSLLLLPRFDPPGGTGGARPPGGRGIDGAPPIGGPEEVDGAFPTTGADRSFVTAFFNLAPLVMSVSKAP